MWVDPALLDLPNTHVTHSNLMEKKTWVMKLTVINEAQVGEISEGQG